MVSEDFIMNIRSVISFLVSILFLLSSCTISKAEIKKSRIFGGVAILSSLAAVYCDARVEEYYRKYRDAKDASQCSKYKTRTQNYERFRDGFILLAFSSVVTSLIFSKIEARGVKINVEGDEKEIRLNLRKTF
jgi:hypothetical protein